MLIVKAGEQVLALNCQVVLEVIPLIHIKAVPQSEKHLAGLIDYRGKLVPVIDLSALLIGRTSKPQLSSRIVLVSISGGAGPAEVLGILAEGVTATSEVEPENLSLISQDIAIKPFLGGVARIEGEMAQEVEVDWILGERLHRALFGSRGLCKVYDSLVDLSNPGEPEGENDLAKSTSAEE